MDVTDTVARGADAPEGAGAEAAGGRAAPRLRVTALTRSLRFDAGGLALNLAATLGRRHSGAVERLDGAERLRAWCEGAGVRLAEGEATEELLAELRLLREAAYDVAVTDLRGSAPALTSVALVNECAHHTSPAPRLEIGPGTVNAPAVPLTGAELRSVIARDLVSLMGDTARRAGLRECDAPACRMLYLDATAGGRRRWCSMQRCGNSAKAAKHRSRSGDRPPAR